MLTAVPMFALVDDDRLSRIRRASAVRDVQPREVIAFRSEPADRLIVIESGGATAVHESESGRRRRLGEHDGPCAVDKAAVLGGGTYSATWVAASRARVRLVPAPELLALVDEVPAVRHHVLRHLAGQVRDRQDELVRANLDGTAARVAAWLLRPGRRRVILPGAQEGLAEAVGATRVTVNRALQSLARDGLVEVEPGAVVILSPEGLAIRAGVR